MRSLHTVCLSSLLVVLFPFMLSAKPSLRIDLDHGIADTYYQLTEALQVANRLDVGESRNSLIQHLERARRAARATVGQIVRQQLNRMRPGLVPLNASVRFRDGARQLGMVFFVREFNDDQTTNLASIILTFTIGETGSVTSTESSVRVYVPSP